MIKEISALPRTIYPSVVASVFTIERNITPPAPSGKRIGIAARSFERHCFFRGLASAQTK